MPIAQAETVDILSKRDKLNGIISGMCAGALWGLVFVAPKLVGNFGPLHLSIGRYLCYGAIALILVLFRGVTLLTKFAPRQWVIAWWLALSGNTLFYILVSYAVQIGGIAMTSLVMGFVPVVVTIIGSRDRGAVPFPKLLPSILLCGAGTVCIAAQSFAPQAGTSFENQSIGLFCAIFALGSWTYYAIGNARAIKSLGQVTTYDWNLLIGIVTGVQSLVLLPLIFINGVGGHDASDWAKLAGVSVSLATFASIVGNGLWNRMCRLLPLTLVGQMIVSETLFALLYGLLWDQRVPTLLELAALVFVVMSVLSCIAAHRVPEKALI